MKKTLLALAVAVALGSPVPAQELADETYEKWFAFTVPQPEELRWRETPWVPTFWDGVLEGQAKEKPILLWAMNGHPLACT